MNEVLALAADDKEEIQRLVREELKYRTKKMNPEIHYIMACFYFDHEDPSWPHVDNIQRYENLYV